jgi:opacity protein-like surface antigen
MLRGVHTLKAGVEFRPDASFALRLGYNYVSPIYKQEAYRDQTLNSPGVYMASTTDYTNWKDTHRLTAGVGFNIEKFRIDVAYQYSATKGDFYPYMSYISGKYIDSSKKEQVMVNEATAVSVKNIRHQLLCTLGYTF